MTLTADEIFAKEPISNIVTPRVLSRVLIGPETAAELSEGFGMRGESAIFAVLVATVLPTGKIFRASMASDQPVRAAVFKTREAAEKHIADMTAFLKNTLKKAPPEPEHGGAT